MGLWLVAGSWRRQRRSACRPPAHNSVSQPSSSRLASLHPALSSLPPSPPCSSSAPPRFPPRLTLFLQRRWGCRLIQTCLTTWWSTGGWRRASLPHPCFPPARSSLPAALGAAPLSSLRTLLSVLSPGRCCAGRRWVLGGAGGAWLCSRARSSTGPAACCLLRATPRAAAAAVRSPRPRVPHPPHMHLTPQPVPPASPHPYRLYRLQRVHPGLTPQPGHAHAARPGAPHLPHRLFFPPHQVRLQVGMGWGGGRAGAPSALPAAVGLLKNRFGSMMSSGGVRSSLLLVPPPPAAAGLPGAAAPRRGCTAHCLDRALLPQGRAGRRHSNSIRLRRRVPPPAECALAC